MNQSNNNLDTDSREAVSTLADIERILTAEIRFGEPITLDVNGAQAGQRLANMKGAWVTLSLTANTGTVTVTHNLNIPTTSITGGGGTAKLPNVRWEIWGLEYGDRTGATAAPAAPAGFSVGLMRMVNGTITADAIDIIYCTTGFVPDATHPLTVTLFVIPATV